MTMPSERARALILAERFLQQLRMRDDTPESIRAAAVGILRHYPDVNEIEYEAEYQLKTREDVLKQAWLLPIDYYDHGKRRE